IKYTNLDGRVNVFYSTPGMYAAAKMAARPASFMTVKTDDFFPYGDAVHSIWSGYFSSRPALKRYIRMASAWLSTAEQIGRWAGKSGAELQTLREAVSLAQHHDAITGTSKQHVANDYAKRISQGFEEMEESLVESMNILMTINSSSSLSLSLCP